ncbi:MAG: hemolysin family protein [Lachnospiraceae bacterium]|nr:hemolysin family protein [Lachnospiraceae bacterium]
MNVSSLLAIALLVMIAVVAALSVVLLRLTGDMKKIDFSKFREEEENEYEEEIMNIAQEGHEQGVILADEAQMISNIFEFGDKDVKDVMQFRQKIVGIEAETSLKDAIDFMVTQHYSRYPVYEEDLDHIIGILNFRDAVNNWLSNPNQSVNEIVRKPVYVHEAMDINELLTQMRNSKIHQAIVVDEFGQTVGLVAMEDILETIVGDILDEYDVEEKEIVKLPGDSGYIASGMVRLDKLEELLDISFDTDEFEILNGFLINEIGHLPDAGEEVCVHFKGYVFKTSEQTDKVLRQIRIEKESEDSTYEL